MIKIDFTYAVAAFLILDVLLVMGLWVAYNYNDRDSKNTNDAEHIQQCPYCCYVFLDYQKSALQTCPQCKSLIDRVNVKGNNV